MPKYLILLLLIVFAKYSVLNNWSCEMADDSRVDEMMRQQLNRGKGVDEMMRRQTGRYPGTDEMLRQQPGRDQSEKEMLYRQRYGK